MATTHRRRWRLRALLATAMVAMALLVPGTGNSVYAQVPTGDAMAKAKFTVTIARFVQWPTTAAPGDADPLKICVLHKSPALGAAFAALEGHRVAGHPVAVVSNPQTHSACELLFVDASAAHGSAAAIAAVAGGPTLTLGAVDGFLSQGGMVELANVNDSLRFDINLKALRAARLVLSSQVMGLARQVRN